MQQLVDQEERSRSIETDLNFCGVIDYKPKAMRSADADGVIPQSASLSELKIEPHRTTVEDGSSAPLGLELDRNGFIQLHHPSNVTDFKDPDQIKTVYHRELRELLTSLVNPDVIEFPDIAGAYRASRADGSDVKESGAAFMAHLDFTEKGAAHAVAHEFPKRRTDVRRWAFIKVWRALSPVAPVDVPLALLDSQTLDPADIVRVDTEYKHIPGITESAALHYNPKQRWIYFSQMKRDDVIVFKNYDSDPNKNFMTGHTAFVDTSAPRDAQSRSSYELRAYVGWF